MELPSMDLLDMEERARSIEKHFHPEGRRCPRCRAPVSEARPFRRTRRSRQMVYRLSL